MIFDNEEQRQIILNALHSAPIQVDYLGIVQAMPKMIAVVEAVKEATIQEVQDNAGEPE